MEPSDLVGSRWQLLSMAGTEPAEGAPITLVFHSESQISGQAGCMGCVATYEADGDNIGLYFLGMTGAAEACPETTLLQEGEYTTHLEQTTNYRLDEYQLCFHTAPGAVLKFERLPEAADASLEDTTWALTAFLEKREQEGMEGAFLLPTDLLAGTEITATFEDGTVHGSAGCNSHGGRYALSGSAVTSETPSATEMGCLDPACARGPSVH